MAIIQKAETSATFGLFDIDNGGELPPSGTFEATIIDVRDKIGVERTKYQSQETEVVDLTAFLFGFRTGGKAYRIDTRPMKISGHPKSALVKFVTGLLGRTPEVGFDTMTLKGTKCLLTIAHAESDGGTRYATVTGAIPLPSGWAERASARPAARPPEIQIADDETDEEIPF